jgi:predicted AAA+ superfamily ATPase
MNKETIKQIIKESQEVKLPKLFSRQMEVPLDSRKIIAVTGPRRSGKTYFLYQLIKQLEEKGIAKERVLYISFDDPRLLPSTAKDIELILESYRELYPEHQDKTNFIFFDEIQNVSNWEVGIRRIHDTRKFTLFITGSSSKLLSKEIATHLRGRAITFEILPFSFKEILAVKNISLSKDAAYSKERFAISRQVDSYLAMGGFPEVVLEKDADLKVRTLKEYWDTMFFRDLVERHNVKNQALVRELMRYLATNIATPFSLNAFYKWIKQTYPTTKRTLISYTSALEDIGLFFLVRKFSFSLKEQTQTPRKCYIIDNGLRSVYGFKFSEDKGRFLENTVFLHLRHLQSTKPLMQVYYWQDYSRKEVDFVVMDGRYVTDLIQVSADIGELKTREREISSLAKASQAVKCKNLSVITLDYEKQEKIGKNTVVFKPLWKWLVGL